MDKLACSHTHTTTEKRKLKGRNECNAYNYRIVLPTITKSNIGNPIRRIFYDASYQSNVFCRQSSAWNRRHKKSISWEISYQFVHHNSGVLRLSYLFVGRWPFNNFLCQLQGFWILLMCAISLETLAVTAVNRYFRVVHSRALYQKIFNAKKIRATIAILWIIAFLAPLPYVVAGHEFSFHPAKAMCAHNSESLLKGYGAFLVLVYVAVPLILIIACYTRVFMKVRKHNLNFIFRLRSSCRSEPSTNRCLSVDEVNVTYTLLVVVTGFLVCWTPVVVIDLIDFLNSDWKLKRQVYVSYTCFAFTSASLNPIIYGVMNRSFRMEYLRILAAFKFWSYRRGIQVENRIIKVKEDVTLEMRQIK